MLRTLFLLLTLAGPSAAFQFEALEGGTIDLDDFRGQAVLVVNTASLCGYTDQYAALQALHDRYAPRGLVVLGVPSNDFAQELESEAAVAEFCEVNYGITLPLTAITPVRGPEAHPFYRWLSETHGVTPRWNFNKALLNPEGELIAFEGARTRPEQMVDQIESVLPR
jgi:glutathione peroxidase